MRTTHFLCVVTVAGLTSGCASITSTTNQSVSVQTRESGGKEVVGAACELTNNRGKWFVTTPGSVMVHKSNDDMQVLCNKANFEPGRAAVISETKGSMFGNILFGGVVGAVVDHSSGAAYEYPTLIQVLMGTYSKIEPPKATDQSAQIPPAPSENSSSSIQLASNSPTLDEKLQELKRLNDAGLISLDVYLERQRKLLEGRQ